MSAGSISSARMADGFDLDMYRVATTGERRGTLVLLQEIFGLTEHIREMCDGFALDGFDVLSPSLFDREEPGLQATYEPADIARCVEIARERHPFEKTVEDVRDTVALAKAGAPVFVLGYCYGGSAAWAAACRIPGITAVASYYGSHVNRMVTETPRCPVILHFGERDAGIPPEDVAKLRECRRQGQLG